MHLHRKMMFNVSIELPLHKISFKAWRMLYKPFIKIRCAPLKNDGREASSIATNSSICSVTPTKKYLLTTLNLACSKAHLLPGFLNKRAISIKKENRNTWVCEEQKVTTACHNNIYIIRLLYCSACSKADVVRNPLRIEGEK